MIDHSHRAICQDLSERFSNAVATSDFDAYSALLTQDCGVWHNFDRKTMDRIEVVDSFRDFLKLVKFVRFDDIRILPTDNGFVQEHVMVGETLDGQAYEAPACMVFTVRDGLIAAMAEYAESSQISVVLDAQAERALAR